MTTRTSKGEIRRRAGIVACAIVVAGATVVTGCGDGSGEGPTESAVQVVDTLVVGIDEGNAANASLFADGHVRVEIRGTDATLRFSAEFRRIAEGKVRADYALHGLPAEALTSDQPPFMDLDLSAVPALEDAVNGTVFLKTQYTNAALGLYDNWGCDLLPGRFNWVASCGTKGACCDVHDACYARFGCTSSSWTSAPWRTCQLLCNAPAVACFLSPVIAGPSVCCFKGNCGRPR
jgi:hypothetical protein